MFLFCFSFSASKVFAAGEFITTWKTNNPGISASNEITIPTNSGQTYNYTVVWGDGQSDIGVTTNITHPYAAPGTYTVTISGLFPEIFFESGGSSDAQKILSIEQWGTNHWVSMYKAFAGCANLVINDAAAPDLSGVTVAQYMFLNDTSLNSNLDNWDVSHITDMYGMFQSNILLNQPFDLWDVSNVTDMGYMFENDTAFNQNLNPWALKTGNVTDMDAMFQSATNFNQPLDTWDVSHVTSMGGMFYSATHFNQSLNAWDVSHVTNMSSMFRNARLFNSNISSWVTSSLTNMSFMFSDAVTFDQTVRFWDVTHVTDMNHIFSGAIAFNQDLHSWVFTSLTNMSYMFAGATSFNEDIHWPTTASVTNMSNMFAGATSFNGVMHGWDVSHVTDMSGMFTNATAFNQSSISAWNTSSVTTMGAMFDQASHFNQNISSWDVSHVTNMDSMFYAAYDFQNGGGALSWGNKTQNVLLMNNMFNLSNFNQDISGWNVSSTTTMAHMFDADAFFNQDISSWNVGNVTDMSYMFYSTLAFDQDIHLWDVSHVTNMSGMFTNVTLSTINYDALLRAWSQLSLQSSVTFDAGNSIYCSTTSQRASMISIHGWIINDGGHCSDNTAPVLTEVVPIPATITDTMAVYTFRSTETGTPLSESCGGGSEVSFDLSNLDAAKVIINSLQAGNTYHCSFDITDNASNTSNELTIGPFTVFNKISGRGFPALVYPKSADLSSLNISINGSINGDVKVTSDKIKLIFNGDPKMVSGYALSLSPDFSNTVIMPYTPSTIFTLPAVGTYTLYAKYYSTTGNTSPVITRTIEYIAPTIIKSNTLAVFIFTRNLRLGSSGPDVKELQKFLNAHGFIVKKNGPGSPGNENNSFGLATAAAVSRFQEANADQILKPFRLIKGNGLFGTVTRKIINKLL